jgi:peptide/nickel transport system substrate-binding protein
MHTSPTALVRASNRIDEFVRSEALALFLVAPHALYALNREVRFRPYRTSFELAECRVSERHHSRR